MFNGRNVIVKDHFEDLLIADWGYLGIFQSSIGCFKSDKLISSLILELEEHEVDEEAERLEEEEKRWKNAITTSARN